MRGQLGGAFGSCTYSKRIGVKQPFDDINRALCIPSYFFVGGCGDKQLDPKSFIPGYVELAHVSRND